MTEKIVTIFGTSRAQRGEEIYILASQIGTSLARAGFIIANGGYNGTMLAAAQAAVAAGGKTIGVTCSAFSSTVNPYITREIKTSCLEERLKSLIELGHAYIVLPGGTGTLLELAMVWELKNKHFSDADKPIILVGEFWKRLVDLMAKDDPNSRSCIQLADGPPEVEKYLIEKFSE